MYKIMLVDDEVWVRRSLKEQIHWSALHAEFCCEAADGENAYRLAMDLRPDIIITDIKMPLMDGIEFMDALQRDLPHIKVIVISGYSEFEYVQKAMVRKATNYILKPIEEQALNESLSLAINEIWNTRLEREEKINLQMTLNQNLPALLEQYLNRIISDTGITGKQFLTLLTDLDIQFDRSSSFLIAVIHTHNYEQLLNTKFNNDDVLLNYSMNNIISKSGEGSTELLSARNIKNKNEHIVLLSCFSPASMHEGEEKSSPRELLHTILDNLRSYLGADASAGIGAAYERIENMTNSYVEATHALKQLRVRDARGVILYEEVRKKDKEPKDDIIGKIVEYMKSNFKEPITLETVAERFALNSSYLSRLFKQECGENFIDFLTRIRIEKASKLMLNPHLKTYEIAEIVGYENTNYFSKVFKKIIGLSPTEYREKFIQD
ncbi:response regulator [Cohnella soli]|uniref:Response regulator n=1 Tax=Cohnella soli TaxID=425005 RepID=A0ABW0HYJ9_9BACL